jgi:hypothetical protein
MAIGMGKRAPITRIPCVNPLRVLIVVEAAGDELAGFLGKPEGLRVACPTMVSVLAWA